MMEQILKAHALQAVCKPVDMPNKSLAVGDDEEHASIPLLIFTNISPNIPTVEKIPGNMRSYEDGQMKGTGATLSLADFETDNFDIGTPY